MEYHPTAKQIAFHTSPADVLLYGGSAGGGKSKALLMEAFVRCLESPGMSAMLFRRTYPELERSLIMESRRTFPKAIAKYNDQKHCWTIRHGGELADSYLWFGFCEHEKNVWDYQSAEWGFLGIDESCHFSQFMFEMLYSRVRSTIPGVRPVARLCTNPGNIGHGWHKKYFEIGKRKAGEVWRPPVETGLTRLPPTRCFIPATVYDNPYLMKHDPEYVARLEALPLTQRKMLLYGDWESFGGQFFGEFSDTLHIIEPFVIPAHWKLYRALDFGFGSPFACLWLAMDETGHAYIFQESYQAGLRDKQQADLVKEKSYWRTGGKLSEMDIEYTVGDPSMCQKSKDSGVSTQENYAAKGITVIPGSNARVHGWMQVRNWLAIDPNTRTPWLQVFKPCVNIIREFQEAIVDDNNPEDINTDGSDHALDAVRYFFSTRPSPAMSIKPAEAIKDDMTRREWAAVEKMRQDLKFDGNRATLGALNREYE